MGRKTARVHAQGEDSRRRILEATLEIAAQRGYDGTTVARITEATGLPASSMYWHFGSKEELLADVLEFSFREWRPAMPTWSAAPGEQSRVEQLENMVRQAITGLAGQPEYWRLGLMLALERRPQEPAARRRFLQVRTEVDQRIATWWRQMLGPEGARGVLDTSLLLAQFTVATLDGLFVAWQSDPGLDLAADRWARVVARGLEAAAARVSAVDRPRTCAPATPSPASEAATSGRDRILLAAAAEAAERGYEGTTISRICARAELPASSLYWAYKDKDDLLAAVVEHGYQQWLAEQPDWKLTPGATWTDALRAQRIVTLTSLKSSPHFLRIGHMLALERREKSPAGRDLFLRVRQHARDRSTEWFTKVLDEDLLKRDPDLPPMLSHLVMALTDGLFLAHQMSTPAWDAELAADVLVEILEAAVQDAAERTRA